MGKPTFFKSRFVSVWSKIQKNRKEIINMNIQGITDLPFRAGFTISMDVD